MSQVSLLFKNRILSVYQLNQQDEFIIGHSADCNIAIDSLAISPKHAKINYADHCYNIEKIDNEAIILINNKKLDSAVHLSDGDSISIGKHTLMFAFDERNEKNPAPPPETFAEQQPKGWLQYLNGKDMGKSIQIKQKMINVNDENKDNIALISNRTDGFYLSYLKGDKAPELNGISIGEKSIKLDNYSNIAIGSQEILFYLE